MKFSAIQDSLYVQNAYPICPFLHYFPPPVQLKLRQFQVKTFKDVKKLQLEEKRLWLPKFQITSLFHLDFFFLLSLPGTKILCNS